MKLFYMLFSLALVIEINALTESKSCMARDCKELFEQGNTCSGVYTIKPDELPAFEVYCDMSNGGWTVFQRRMDGTVNFYRNWADYLEGFGDLKGEFWLGLDKIHRLTMPSSSLRVDLKDFAGASRYALYSLFKVHGADTKFRLTVSGFNGNSNAGDSLTYHNGMKFSTKDKDNDINSGHCAIAYKGAWWYRSCHLSNLNGLYLAGAHSSYANGVNWHSWRGYKYSHRVTEMKTRRN